MLSTNNRFLCNDKLKTIVNLSIQRTCNQLYQKHIPFNNKLLLLCDDNNTNNDDDIPHNKLTLYSSLLFTFIITSYGIYYYIKKKNSVNI